MMSHQDMHVFPMSGVCLLRSYMDMGSMVPLGLETPPQALQDTFGAFMISASDGQNA